MSEATPERKQPPGTLGPLPMTLEEIRTRGVPIRRQNDTILLGKSPPEDVVVFVKEHKIELLFELAAEDASNAVRALKIPKNATLEHLQAKEEMAVAWLEMDQAWEKRDIYAFDTARAKWVIAARKRCKEG